MSACSKSKRTELPARFLWIIYSHSKKGEIYEEPRSKVEPFVLSDEANKFAEKKYIALLCTTWSMDHILS